jgi:hypothetical protein
MSETETPDLGSTATTGIALEAHHCANRHTYLVRFEGPDAEAWAIAWATARRSTHVISLPLDPETDLPAEFDDKAFPALWDYLHPLCEHRMSADLCYGPAHYCSPEEIAAGW